MKHDIIIVGGGMAGIGCAHRLLENGYSFTMITEDIGGRVKTSPDGKVNYGAYYLTADYKNTLPFAEIGKELKLSEACFHNGNERYRFLSYRFLKHIPAFLRLYKDARKARKHFVKQCELGADYPRDEIVENDPFAKKYFHQIAGDYIRERRLDAFVDEYLQPLLWGVSFFGDCRKVSTAIFLGSMMVMLSRPRRFIMHCDKMIEKFKENIIFDSVAGVKCRNGLYELTTTSGEHYECEKLVLATPMHITNGLVKPQKIKGGANVSYYHVTGDLKEPYKNEIYNIFPIAEQTAIGKEADGSYLYYYTGDDRISTYFRTWTVITHDEWTPCLYIYGDHLVDVHPEPNLFLANDHNIFGMEQAYLSGKYAAKLVMRSLQGSSPHRQAGNLCGNTRTA